MKGMSMLKIKEILRLKCEARLSNRKIARALNISHSMVDDYIKELKLTDYVHLVPFIAAGSASKRKQA